MTLSNSSFLHFKTNRIFKQFLSFPRENYVIYSKCLSIVGKTNMSRTFLSIEFKPFRREIKAAFVESCFSLRSNFRSTNRHSIFRYL